MELTVVKTLSKRVEVSNANDADKVYDIKANVYVSNGTVGNVESGSVTLDGAQKASFSRYATNNKNINFSCSDTDEEVKVMSLINTFIETLETTVSEE